MQTLLPRIDAKIKAVLFDSSSSPRLNSVCGPYPDMSAAGTAKSAGNAATAVPLAYPPFPLPPGHAARAATATAVPITMPVGNGGLHAPAAGSKPILSAMSQRSLAGGSSTAGAGGASQGSIGSMGMLGVSGAMTGLMPSSAGGLSGSAVSGGVGQGGLPPGLPAGMSSAMATAMATAMMPGLQNAMLNASTLNAQLANGGGGLSGTLGVSHNGFSSGGMGNALANGLANGLGGGLGGGLGNGRGKAGSSADPSVHSATSTAMSSSSVSSRSSFNGGGGPMGGGPNGGGPNGGGPNGGGHTDANDSGAAGKSAAGPSSKALGGSACAPAASSVHAGAPMAAARPASSLGGGGGAATASSNGGAGQSLGGGGADAPAAASNGLLSDLKLLEEVGEGSGSKVWRGRWGSLLVAVKVLKVAPHTRKEALRGFVQEATILSQLRHSAICTLLGTCMQQGLPALVLEFMSGGSLFDLLHNSNVTLTPPLLSRLALEVATGVAYLHEHSVIHRDIKSANVLLDDRLHAKVSDFGISTRFAPEHTAETGTYRSMAPEVITHQSYDHHCDVFSYGILLWEMTHREIPFGKDSGLQAAFAVAVERRRPEIKLPPPLAGFGELITRAWAHQPASRPSMQTVVVELLVLDQRVQQNCGGSAPIGAAMRTTTPGVAGPCAPMGLQTAAGIPAAAPQGLNAMCATAGMPTAGLLPTAGMATLSSFPPRPPTQ